LRRAINGVMADLTASMSTHDFGLASDLVHSELDEGSLVEYLVAFGSRGDHDIGGVCTEVVPLPRGAWVFHATHRRVIRCRCYDP
jgi:hypothetical protein